jgi:hypothetical protein
LLESKLAICFAASPNAIANIWSNEELAEVATIDAKTQVSKEKRSVAEKSHKIITIKKLIVRRLSVGRIY